MIPTSRRQVAPRNYSQFDSQALQQNGHQVGNHDYRKQGVVVSGARGQVSRPVSRIHVPDCDQKTGSGKRQKFTKESRGCGNGQTTEDLWQAGTGYRTSPALLTGFDYFGRHRSIDSRSLRHREKR